MPILDFSAVLTGAVTAAVIATASWLFVFLTRSGKTYWRNIRAVAGGKITATIGLVSLTFAISAFLMTFLQPTSIKVTNIRIGPNGIEASNNSPGEFTSATPGFQSIPSSENSQICTAIQYNNASGTCQLHVDGNVWKMLVTGAAACRASCYRLELKR